LKVYRLHITEVQWLLGRGVGGADWDGRHEQGEHPPDARSSPPSSGFCSLWWEHSSSCPCSVVVAELLKEGEMKPDRIQQGDLIPCP